MLYMFSFIFKLWNIFLGQNALGIVVETPEAAGWNEGWRYGTREWNPIKAGEELERRARPAGQRPTTEFFWS